MGNNATAQCWTWTTEAEISFLKRIVSGFSWRGSEIRKLSDNQRTKILVGYMDAIPNRKYWNGIDKKAIVGWLISNLPLDERHFVLDKLREWV